MRISKNSSLGDASSGRPGSRRGVILIVVLTLLTLFTIVGISFVYYADTAKRGNLQFREDARDLAQRTVVVAEDLGPDLLRSEFEEVDFRPHLTRINTLAERAECLRARIVEARDRETDPESRRNLDVLAHKIEVYEAGVEELASLIERIELGE